MQCPPDTKAVIVLARAQWYDLLLPPLRQQRVVHQCECQPLLELMHQEPVKNESMVNNSGKRAAKDDLAILSRESTRDTEAGLKRAKINTPDWLSLAKEFSERSKNQRGSKPNGKFIQVSIVRP